MTRLHPNTQSLIDQLLASGRASPQTLRGCGEADIASLEQQYGLTLPRCYRDFLSIAGRQAGDFLKGSDFLYPRLLDLGAAAKDLLHESSAHRLDGSAFVFWMHQGYQFAYFRTDSGDPDPEVLNYLETWDAPRHTGKSFTRHFQDVLTAESKLMAKVRLRRGEDAV